MGKPNRGAQLHQGALFAKGEWLLFLHADSRMEKDWSKKMAKVIEKTSSKNYAWFFQFRVNKKSPIFKILELAVLLRSNIFKEPYGDQGLLLSKELYFKLGGYKEIHIMEDIDLIQRISRLNKLKGLKANLITDARRWEKVSIIKNTIRNALLRYRWSKGEDPEKLFNEYYSIK